MLVGTWFWLALFLQGVKAGGGFASTIGSGGKSLLASYEEQDCQTVSPNIFKTTPFCTSPRP